MVYAVSFLMRLRKVTWYEWTLFLTSCYLIAATAAMGYQRYRMAFYPLGPPGRDAGPGKGHQKSRTENN